MIGGKQMKLENFVVTKFDTSSDDLVEKLPYVLENTETKERLIGVLKNCECDMLAFSTWKGVIVISPADAEKYNIYKADLTDGMYLLFKGDSLSISASHEMSEEKMKQIKDAMSEEGVVQMALFNQRFDNVSVLDVNDCPQQISTIVCHRIIDYINNDANDALTTGIEYFYTVLAHVTIIRQFLYKVTREKDSSVDLILYQIMLPASESDKEQYMNAGWKIHPMFYNKENDCYMPTVRIQRPMQLMTFPNCDKDDSITLQILSGLQLLHLIEHGPNEKDKEEPGLYVGLDYSNDGIIISNASTNENNHLIIDGEGTVILKGMAGGYISRFLYWNDKYDWLFFPKETVTNANRSMSDSEFVGPTLGVNNIIKWGSIESASFGIFGYWMRSTEASENDYVIPWEFGGE